MTQGIFVRACPGCRKRVQTHDQTGQTKCAKCEAKSPTPPTPEPMALIEDESDDDTTPETAPEHDDFAVPVIAPSDDTH